MGRNSLSKYRIKSLMRIVPVLSTGLMAILLGCSHEDQQKAREKAEDARDKTTSAAHKLGTEAEMKARELNEKMGAALDGQHPGATGASSDAKAKLHHAAALARQEGRQAGAKLDHAGLLAKVKAKLVNEVGLDTLSKVDVDLDGSVATLNGSVSSEDQKRQAQRSVSGVEGITRVVNNLNVQQ